MDNLDSRFANLERWQANNWLDPDEQIKPKQIKKNLTKVVKAKTAKPKASASSGLQQMMRKMQSEMHKNKAAALAATNTDSLTPPTGSRRCKSATPQSAY